jgi:hypothetical protein
MEGRVPTGDRLVTRQLELELRLVAEAIEMVASGGSRRVTLAGLQLGEQLIGAARRMAVAAGVRVVPEWSAGDSGVDLVVEAMDR